MTGPTIQSLFPFTIPDRWTPEQAFAERKLSNFVRPLSGTSPDDGSR
jgi:hypothetical protein